MGRSGQLLSILRSRYGIPFEITHAHRNKSHFFVSETSGGESLILRIVPCTQAPAVMRHVED